MRVVVLDDGSYPSHLLKALREHGVGVMCLEQSEETLRIDLESHGLGQGLCEALKSPMFLDDLSWTHLGSMCPVEFIRWEQPAAPFLTKSNIVVKPYFKEHYDDE